MTLPSPYLHFEHAEGDLEEHDRALIEEEIPYPQQHLSMNHTRKSREEPVQGDQGQF